MQMGNCAVVGINWGDEGKGRMVDLLTGDYDVVVRFQGGGNAGHTVINEKGKFALHLLPSGVFREGVLNILGNGVAVDPENLWKEIQDVADKGVDITPEGLKISDRASLLMPWHRELDGLEEARLADKNYGSTKQGIAPFYSDKYQKKTVLAGELFYPEHLREHAKELLELFAAFLLDLPEHVREELLFELHDILERVDVGKLNVEAGKLRGGLGGEGFLRAEYRADLEVTVKTGGHGHLLIKLRALCEVRVPVEIFHFKDVRTGFARGADQLRRMDLDEITLQKEFTKRTRHLGLHFEEQLIPVGPQIDPAIVQTLVHAGTRYGRALFRRRDLFPLDRQRRRDRFDPNLLRNHFETVQLHVFGSKGRTGDRNHRIASKRCDLLRDLREFFLLDRDLQFSCNVLQNDKRHL